MPRGDRTGPWGAGPMTGRAAGYCAGYPVPGFMNPYGGRSALGLGVGRGGFPYGGGRGRTWGGGRGWGWRSAAGAYGPGYYGMPPAYPAAAGAYGPDYYGMPPAYPAAPYQATSPEQEMEMLRNQASALEEELVAIRNRIEELGKSQDKGK